MTKISRVVLAVFMLATALIQADYESKAPVDFTLQRLHGTATSLSAYRQKWVVLNYWATWCAPCRKEIPDLSALHESRDDIVVLGLAFEDTEIENFDELENELQRTDYARFLGWG